MAIISYGFDLGRGKFQRNPEFDYYRNVVSQINKVLESYYRGFSSNTDPPFFEVVHSYYDEREHINNCEQVYICKKGQFGFEYEIGRWLGENSYHGIERIWAFHGECSSKESCWDGSCRNCSVIIYGGHYARSGPWWDDVEGWIEPLRSAYSEALLAKEIEKSKKKNKERQKDFDIESKFLRQRKKLNNS